MIQNRQNAIEYTCRFDHDRRKEIPCRDMDMDCLPDEKGNVPFGSYIRCYLYDSDKGGCPFIPLGGE